MITSLDVLISSLKFKLVDYLQEHQIEAEVGKKISCISGTHKDSTPSLAIGKDGTFAKCFSCGCAYDIFTVANLFEGMPLDGPEFITETVFGLAERYGIKHCIPAKSNEARLAFKFAYLRAYKIVAEYIQDIANTNPTDCFLKEIKKRKWQPKESIKLGLGCVRTYKEIYDLLIKNGFTKNSIEEFGLARSDIFNQDGLIFTIYDEHKNPVAFYMRDVRYEEKKAEFEAKDHKDELVKKSLSPKYNSSSNCPGIYEKKLHPYGLNDIKNFHKIILVEGHGCKHSLKLADIDNVIALGGTALNEQTLARLSSLGVTNIVLLLDNDAIGREKLKDIIRQYYGKTTIEFSVMDMGMFPDVKDPDELLRKWGIEAFKQLHERNALEWVIVNEVDSAEDKYAVVHEVSYQVALERSPINRLRLINIIADMTDIEKSVIQEEVNQRISVDKNRKNEYALKIIDEAKEIITMNPDALSAALDLIESKLSDFSKDSLDIDQFSSSEFLKAMNAIKELHESGDSNPVINIGFSEFDKVCTLPATEALIYLVGVPNAGKSAMLINIINRIQDLNDDVINLAFTNDDSRNIYVSRYVAINSKLKINWVTNPKKYLTDDLMVKREQGYQKLGNLVAGDQIVIKDVIHGYTVEYVGRFISYYRNKYPNKKLFITVDNASKLGNEIGMEDGSPSAMKYISGQLKTYTTKYSCVLMATVELNKAAIENKPTSTNCLADSRALQYDANLIVYLWNEIHSKRDTADQRFKFTYPTIEYVPNVGHVQETKEGPIIEALFLKNKLSEFKGSLFFKLYPEFSAFEDVSMMDAKLLFAELPKEPPKGKSK
jgi:DNA primase